VYLINCMPSHTLHNSTPFTNLFKAEPTYSTLRFFGYACYPLLHPYNKHKLEFRSKQCIFIGYNSNHKGYRCMDPTTSRVYLSRNVVFDETLFPTQEKATASLLSTKELSSSPCIIFCHLIFILLFLCPLLTHKTHPYHLLVMQEPFHWMMQLSHPLCALWTPIPPPNRNLWLSQHQPIALYSMTSPPHSRILSCFLQSLILLQHSLILRQNKSLNLKLVTSQHP